MDNIIMKMKNITYIIMFFIMNISIYSQIKIETNTGKEYSGFIINNTKDSINIISMDNMKNTILRKDIKEIYPMISKIKLINGNIIDGYVSEYDDYGLKISSDESYYENKTNIFHKDILFMEIFPKNGMEYLSLGLTFGTPGTININVGYNYKNLGIRTSIGDFPNTTRKSAQLNIIHNIYSERNIETGISLGIGYSKDMEDEFLYVGPFYHLNIYGLFFEVGMGIGSGNYTNPQTLFQLGYIYRFNK